MRAQSLCCFDVKLLDTPLVLQINIASHQRKFLVLHCLQNTFSLHETLSSLHNIDSS